MLKILKRAVPLVTAFTLIGAQLCAKSADKTPNEIKTELAFSVLTDQSITDVKENFNLPTEYEGAFILWESDNENALCIDGGRHSLTARVIRPPFGEGYAAVTLTAYISKDDTLAEKSFLLRIKEQEIGFKYSKSITDAYKLFEMDFLAKQDLQTIKSDLLLPKTDAYSGITLSYMSDTPAVLSNDGKVTRGYDTDSVVTFTVFFTKGFESFKASYPVTVKAYTDDDVRQCAQRDVDAAVNKIKASCNLLSLDKSITLPTAGNEGSVIKWSTSDPGVIDAFGSINKSANGKSATLTATATYHGASVSAEISVTLAQAIGTITEIEGNKGLGNVSSGGGGGGSSQSKNDKNNESTAPQPTEQTALFYDVQKEHWAFEQIEEMTKRGITDGNGDKTFSPDNPVTREQALKLIVNTLSLKCDGSFHPFADVEDNSWYEPFVITCFSAGIVKGVEEHRFGVGEAVSRQDFCVMLLNAMKYREITLPDAASTVFSDEETIAEYAAGAVNALSAAKIIGGMPDGSFKPLNGMTRAEAAVVLYRVLNK